MSDALPRTLIANLPGVAYRCANDADSTIEFLSDGILTLTGYPAKDFVGKPIRDYDMVIHPDDQVTVREAAQEALERSEPFQVTYRIVTAAGDIRWVWEQGVGVVDDSGSVALEGFITDVTDRVHTEQELRVAKGRLEQLVGSMTEGLAELDPDGVHVDVNAAFTAMTGFSREELIGVGPPHPYWPPEEIAAIEETFSRDMTGRPASAELTFMRKNGERFPVVVSPFVIRDDQGAIVSLSATFRDITGQRAAEEATRQRVGEGEKLVEAGLALIGCHTKDEVFDVITRHFSDMLPDAVTLVNRCPVDPRHIVVHSVTGMDSSMLVRAAELVGFDIVGKTAVVAERDLGRTFVRSLQQFDGGFEAYVAGNAPRSAAKLVKKLLGFHDVYIIGITDGTTVFGNVSVLTREPDAVLPARAIESFVQQAFLTLARIRTSRRLAESEEKYRMLAEGMADMVWTLDPETLRFTYVSPSVQRLRGYTPEEVLAEPLDAALAPESAAYLKALNRTRAADRCAGRITDSTFFTEEVQQPCKDGSLIWTESVTNYCLDERTGRVEVRGVTRDITERRLAEDALRQNERWLSESQQVASLGHYIFDIVNDFWDGSPALHDVLGTKDGKGGDFAAWLQIVHPADRERLANYFAEDVLGRRQPFDIEYRIVRPRDGVERYVHGLGTVDFSDDDRPLQMFGVIQDITEHHAAERELRESTALLQAAMDHSPVGIAIADAPDGALRYVNDAGLMIRGGDRQAIVDGVGISEYVASWQMLDLDGRPLRNDEVPLARALMLGEPSSREFIIRRDDGDDRIVLANAAPIKDESGKVTAAMVIFTDMTERRRAAEDLRRSRMLLESSLEAQKDTILFSIDADYRYLLFNQAHADVMKAAYGKDIEVGMSILDQITDEGDWAAAKENYDRALAGESHSNVRVFGDVEKAYYESFFNPIVNEDGKIVGATGLARDVSERKRVEDEVRRLNADLEQRVQERTEELQRTNEELQSANSRLTDTNLELEEATSAKNDFFAAMSHELRTPLNSIIGFSGILLQGLAGTLEPEQRTQVEMVNRSGLHLLSLIDGVLDLAKVEAGKASVTFADVDPVGLLRDVSDVVRPLAGEKGLYLEMEDAEFAGCFRSDGGKLRQVLFNLVGNAVKFTEHGGVRVAVRCEPGGMCAFNVSDTGPGIGPADLSRIFDPFVQLETPTVAKPKGTGLGLALSREYAHLLGGDVTAVSEVGVGSTFTLRLPIEPPAPE
ncbi:MAG: PAS domain S-box protein [Coriobacteriia bacterium]|nr:PAS domain S-box protein [Coriobacteriia bacterium]